MPMLGELDLIRGIVKEVDGFGCKRADAVANGFQNLSDFIACASLPEFNYSCYHEKVKNKSLLGEELARVLYQSIKNYIKDKVLDSEASFEQNRDTWLFYKAEKKFFEYLEKKKQAIEELTLSELLPNPYMLFLLKDSDGLDNVDDLVNFLIAQHLERSFVTSYGGVVESIAGLFCGGKTKKKKKHVDLQKECKGVLYGVSVKSGPNTINKPDVDDIRSALDNWKKEQTDNGKSPDKVRVALGLTYGNNPSVYSREVEDENHYLFYGRGFWEFISQDVVSEPLETYLKIKDAAERAASCFGFNAIRDAIGNVSIQLKEEFAKIYYDKVNKKINWDKLLRDNM